MTKDAANSTLAFACGLCLLLLLEAGAAFLVLGGFDTEGARAETDLPAVTLLTDLRGTFTDLQGNEHSFADLRGKVVLLNLWATWCPPCRAEMPSLQALWKNFEGDDRVRVLCISTETAAEVRAHPMTSSLTMPVFVFSSPAPEELDTESLPTTYIFNREGRVVFGHTGMARWDSPEVVAYLKSLLE
jgi:thiol-disulfide isomerase/thioredoxin